MSAAEAVTAAISSALSAGNGLASGPVLAMTASPTRTSKQPLLFEVWTVTVASGPSASSRPRAIFVARVLKTDHDRHASISMGGYVPGASASGAVINEAATAGANVGVETDAAATPPFVTSRSMSSALRPDTGRPAARSLSLSCTTFKFVRSSSPVAAIALTAMVEICGLVRGRARGATNVDADADRPSNRSGVARRRILFFPGSYPPLVYSYWKYVL